MNTKPAMNTKPDIDPAAFREIKLLFGEEFEQRLAAFIGHTESYLNNLEAALKADNHEEARAVAHKIISSTGQYGALKLSQLAWDLEHGDKINSDTYTKYIPEMKEEFRKFKLFSQPASR